MTEPCSGCGTPLHLHTATPTRPLLCSECSRCRVCGGNGQGSVTYLHARPAAPGERHVTHTHRDPCGACRGTGRAP